MLLGFGQARRRLTAIGSLEIHDIVMGLVAFASLRQHEGFQGKNNHLCGILWFQEEAIPILMRDSMAMGAREGLSRLNVMRTHGLNP
jgi:hypothetical protein